LSDLDLEAKWWLPDKEQEPRVGKLTLNQQQKHGELLLNGSFPPREGVDKNRYDYDIILGELTDGQKVTLNGCTLNWIHPYLTNFEQSSFSVKYILLREHFESPEDIFFSKIHVVYQGPSFDKWVKRFNTQGNFRSILDEQRILIQYTLGRPVRVEINNNNYNHIITLFSKPIRLRPSTKVMEASIKEVPCFEIKSLKGKCLHNYINANNVLRDFLDFIIPEEVHIKSIYGILENKRDSQGKIIPSKAQQKEVQIFYRWNVPEMFKPLRDQPIFPRNIFPQTGLPEVQFEKYLKRWFRLSEKPIINLYCGVMFNPEMYIEHLFLGLAFAIDSYHRIFIRKESPEKQQYKQELNRIANLLPKEDEKKRLVDMAKSCYQPSIKEMVKDVYHEYFFLGDSLFKHKGEEDFSDKVKATRNYFSHGSEGGMKNVVLRGDDLTYLTVDVQLLLQFCILTQLGFSKLDIIRIFDPTQIPVWVNVSIESIEMIKKGRSGIPVTLVLFSHFFYYHSPLPLLNYYRTL
jgi:ApeA N-terminal domain 1